MDVKVTEGIYSRDSYDHRLCALPDGSCWVAWAAFGRFGTRVFARRFDGECVGRIHMLSDAPRLQAWMRLASLGMVNYFDVVVTYDDTGKRKPAPEPFQKALELLEVEPGEAVMIGDWAERDIVGAKEIGMYTVFARYGDRFGTKNSGADAEINDILELIPVIEKINQGK